MDKPTFEKELKSFFIQWENLKVVETIDQPKINFLLETEKLASFFSEFEIAYQPIYHMQEQGFFVNVWQTAGLKRDEVRNNQVLKWFLDCHANHGLKNTVLETLIQSSSLNIDTPNEYYTYAENYPIQDGKNRIDIEIESDEILLFLEIKIDASEGFEQLKRYQNVAQIKAKNKKWAIIYITPYGKLPHQYLNDDIGSSPNLYTLSWSKFAKKILKNIQKKDLHNPNVWLLKQFAEHLKNF